MEMAKAYHEAIYSLCRDVRDVDRREWSFTTAHDLPEAIFAGTLYERARNWALWEDGDCQAIFGAHPTTLSGIGRAWFIGTNSLMQRVHKAHGFFEEGMADLHKGFPVLIASSWHRNTVHHRWMERMGFAMFDTEVIGREQFFTFIRVRKE